MQELFQQIEYVFLCVMPFNGSGKFVGFDSDGLMQTLAKPEITLFSIIALALIVFTETGLMVGFFLPGDSLLVTAGLVAWNSAWPLYIMIPILIAASIVGDSTGYFIGRKVGPALFRKEDSLLFKKKHLETAQGFYDEYGGKTIILAKFVPIVRTFAPVVAGAGKMNYSRFLPYSVCGSVAWITSMVLLGYALTTLLNPLFKNWFGPEFEIRKHLEKVIIAVVFFSVAIPAGIVWFKKRTPKPAPIPEASNA